jgi:hypothetical protein
MAEIIRERRRIITTEYERVFSWRNDPDSGFGFPCDEHGNLLEGLQAPGLENYQKCLSGEYDVIDHGVELLEYASVEPAVLRCDCGAEVLLWDAFLETCGRCGRDYNGNGQLLAPRSQWGEETGESLADIFSPYDPEEL